MNTVIKKVDESLSLTCPKCGGKMSVEGVERKRENVGEQGMATCTTCGHQARVVMKLERREVFEWGFDNGARTVFWDITALYDHLNDEPFDPARMYRIEPDILALFVAWNPQVEDIATDRESTAPEDLPILIIPHPSALPECVEIPILPIDGWHRIVKAHKEGKSLIGYLIPSPVEKRFRIHEVYHVGCKGWEPERRMFNGEGKTLLEVMEEQAEEKTILNTKP